MRQRRVVMSLFVFGWLALLACAQPQTTTTQTPTPKATPISLPLATPTASSCASAEKEILQEVTTTPASPYFVHHPVADTTVVATVIFLPGGSGSRRSAQRAWGNYLSNGRGADSFRVVVPYAVSIDFIDDAVRTFKILDEVLRCYGGDAAKVHIGGVSNGGLAAFALMLARPERFATLLGAPGAFPREDPATWSKALAGHAVFNGVGANDAGWRSEVKTTHDALAAAGIESVYVEFAGQGHTVNDTFDESVFFEFWAKH